jgi:hypothetical protein
MVACSRVLQEEDRAVKEEVRMLNEMLKVVCGLQ